MSGWKLVKVFFVSERGDVEYFDSGNPHLKAVSGAVFSENGGDPKPGDVWVILYSVMGTVLSACLVETFEKRMERKRREINGLTE